ATRTPLPRPSRGITSSRRNSIPRKAAPRGSRYSRISLPGPREDPASTVPMLIIPAIDLKDGRCVRLEQGDMATAMVFSDDPGKTAAHWAGLGARRMHVVDLN